MPGPPPTPSTILELRGSWRAKRKGEPKPEGLLPKAPKSLDRAEQLVWRQLVKLLSDMNVGRAPDANALERYCNLFVRYRTAAEFLRKYGETYPLKDDGGKVKCFMPFPQVPIVNKLCMLLLALEQQFGLTPSARARLNCGNAIKPAIKSEAAKYFESIGNG